MAEPVIRTFNEPWPKSFRAMQQFVRESSLANNHKLSKLFFAISAQLATEHNLRQDFVPWSQELQSRGIFVRATESFEAFHQIDIYI